MNDILFSEILHLVEFERTNTEALLAGKPVAWAEGTCTKSTDRQSYHDYLEDLNEYEKRLPDFAKNCDVYGATEALYAYTLNQNCSLSGRLKFFAIEAALLKLGK